MATALYSAELARTTGRLNVATISVARSIPSRPSIEKCMAVGLGSHFGCHSLIELDDTKEYRCTRHMESLSSGRAAKAYMS